MKEENGPLTLVKKYAKKFIENLNYKNRSSYNHLAEDQYKDYLFKNTGKAGEVLLCNTTELIHRAGDPMEGKFRDMISLHFVAYPTTSQITIDEFKDRVFDDQMIKEISKIKGVKKPIRYYKKSTKQNL